MTHSPPSQHYLKVLQGINKGAIANLTKRITTIGSSQECDVILAGYSTPEKRFEINFEQNTLSIKAINKPLYLDGIKIHPSNKFINLNIFQQIDIDSSSMVIAKKGEKWPEEYIGKNGVIRERRSKANMLSSIGKYIQSYKLQGLPNRHKIYLGAFFIMALTSIFFMRITSPPKEMGILTSSKKNKHVEQEIAPLYIQKNVTRNISTRKENALKEAYLLLQSFNVNRINLDLNEDGLLKAEGYVGNSKNWEKAKTAILGDIDAIKKVNTDKVETFMTRMRSLNDTLLDEGIKKHISLKGEENLDIIILTGELSDTGIIVLDKIKNDFTNQYSEPLLKSEVIDLRKNLNLSIQSVNIGNTKYFVSKAGKKYLIGSDLGNGYKIIDIEVDKITLLYEDKTISYFYNDLIRNSSNITKGS